MSRFFGAMLLLVLVSLVACGPAPVPVAKPVATPQPTSIDGKMWGTKIVANFTLAVVCPHGQICPESIQVTGWYFFNTEAEADNYCPDQYRLNGVIRYNPVGGCTQIAKQYMYPSQGTSDDIKDLTTAEESAP